MNKNYRKILRNRKHGITRRLAPRQWSDQPRPMLKASNIRYEIAQRTQAVRGEKLKGRKMPKVCPRPT